MHHAHRRPAYVRIASLAAIVLAAPCLRADEDSIEGPWGTVHGDLSGTAATTEIAYGLGEGPVEEKWRVDVVGEGHDRPGGRSSIVFDAAGNLYWISSTGGGTGGQVRLVSVSPDGVIRWAGNDGAGSVHPMGTIFSGASPVVGQARVYALGDILGGLAVFAYDKATGENVWTADLTPSTIAAGGALTPVLHQGKLWVVGLKEGKSRDFHQVDAETGDIDWSSSVDEVGITANHQATFIADAFDAGVHGLFFNGDSGNGTDLIGETYGIRLAADGASLGWAADAGKAARSHVIHSQATGLLYTFTWTDYGGEAYVFEPTSGLVATYNNSINTGHGFYDVGCLDFDGTTFIAGGFDGNILRYTDAGGGSLSDEVIYKGGTAFPVPYWGETRVLGQLLQAPGGNSVLLTATNSFQCCASHVVALDVTEKKVLWRYDTGSRSDHQFLYAGGPVMGPDGKVYFFPRPAGGATALVAIGPAERPPQPTAGFIVVDEAGRPVATGTGMADPCVNGGASARLDASCSTGSALTYTWTVEPPEGAVITQAAETDPSAEIRFLRTGILEVVLEVASGGDGARAECRRFVCVIPTAPACALTVTDLAGGAIDSADDGDAVPCLPAGGTALAEAGPSIGGDLEYIFEVTPLEGVTIEGDSASPQARITIAAEGTYRVGLTVINSMGDSTCAERTICVKSAVVAKRFRRGDCNADGGIDLSDGISHLGTLFLGDPPPPCAEACDSNGDGGGDLSDAIYLLTNLFLGGPAPPEPHAACGSAPGGERIGCDQSTC